MTVTITDVQDDIKDLVCDILEVEPEEVTRESLFKEASDTVATISTDFWAAANSRRLRASS